MAECYDLIVSGGTVADGHRTYLADIAIRDGSIAAIGEALGSASEVIDAKGLLVLPGGIDSHCHIEQDNPGSPPCADDFTRATIAAACGGTTMVIPFAMTRRGDHLPAVVTDYRAKADRKAVIDFGIHITVTDRLDAPTTEAIRGYVADGCNSIKLFTTYDGYKLDDDEVLATLQLARSAGALPIIHCENDAIIRRRTAALLAAGNIGPEFHALSRPIIAEREAVHRAALLAEEVGTPLLVLHVSGREPLDEIARARRSGQPLFAETCPHYLLLTATALERSGLAAYGLLCAPPLRTSDDQEALWAGLGDGTIQLVSSDHAPTRFALLDGPPDMVPQGNFVTNQRGLPGLELRLPLLFSAGVAGGRISLDRFVAVSAVNAAKLYGIYPRKGSISVGADADLALWDPGCKTTIRYDMLHDATGYTPYEGVEVTGWPLVTLSRGEVVHYHGKFAGAPGRGRFVAGATMDAARRLWGKFGSDLGAAIVE